jgi:hypothetical protein
MRGLSRAGRPVVAHSHREGEIPVGLEHGVRVK